MLSEETKQAMMLSLLGLEEKKPKRNQVADSMTGKVCMFRTYSSD